MAGNMDGSLRERALDAYRAEYEERRADLNQIEEGQAETLISLLQDILNVAVDPEDIQAGPYGPVVDIDGFKLGIDDSYDPAHMQLFRNCERCGSEVRLHPIWNLTDLGRFIQLQVSDSSLHRWPET